MNRIALIDVSSILHAAKHSVGKKNKLSHNERYTFVIFGFLFKLRSIAQNSLADQLVFCLDSDSSIRKEKYFTEYKSKRNATEKTPEQIELDEMSFPQFNIVKKQIIPKLGFKNIFQAEGFEADDIIGRLCQQYDEHEIVIVSGDEDMYQLLNRKVSIMKPKDNRWYNIVNFRNEYGIEPSDWRKVKVYGGCKSDGVPGLPMPNDDPNKKVRHVGEGTALNYIKGKLNPSTQAYRAFLGKEAERIINRNKFLTILPLRGTPKFNIQRDTALSKSALIEICKEYNFKSIMQDINDFAFSLRLR